MDVDINPVDVRFDELDGPGPGVAEVEVETYRELAVASDLLSEFGADAIPLRDATTGELFSVPFREIAEHIDNLLARSAA